ncbi:MAG: hypothetical protein KF761_05450 [Salinibacterium sp.]|nr:hypothetical protein [Salinibacterium sp.]
MTVLSPAPTRAPSLLQYVSVMKSGEHLEPLDRWVVRINKASGSGEVGTLLLGPAYLFPTTSDSINLLRIDHDLSSILVTRASNWQETAHGWVAWVEFDDAWDDGPMGDSIPSGGLAMELEGLK